MLRPLIVVFLWTAAGVGAAAQVPYRLSATELKRLRAYYADTSQLNVVKLVAALSVSDEKARSRAARYLIALMEQARTDMAAGRSAWHATGRWIRSSENNAEKLREDLARQLMKRKRGASALPVVHWLIRDDSMPLVQVLATYALVKMTDPAATKLLVELAATGPRNTAVQATALDGIVERRLSRDETTVRRLAHHHRESIRTPARKLAKTLGHADPGPFDATAAVKRPHVAELLKRLRPYLPFMPAKKHGLTEVKTVFEPGTDDASERFWPGWLLAETEADYTMFTLYGRRMIIPKKGVNDEFLPRAVPMITGVVVSERTPGGAEAIVARFEKLRAEKYYHGQLAWDSAMTQFTGAGCTLPEMYLGCWLQSIGRHDLAARVILPAIDCLYADEHLVDAIRAEMGRVHGQHMLAAFMGDRDYKTALRLARLIGEHYPKTAYSKHAAALAEQLPRRMDDFVTFKLPLPDAWKKIRAGLDRAAAIRYLCERFRLMDSDDKDVHYAEPPGMTIHAAYGLGRGKTEVINPLAELLGGDVWDGEDFREHEGMKPTLADVPVIAPFLMDDWLVLTLSFWRDFHPGRTLVHTREVHAAAINEIAGWRLVDGEKLNRMDGAGRRREVERVVAWSKKHAGKPEAERLLGAFDDLPALPVWPLMEPVVKRLVVLGRKKDVLPLLVRYAELDSTSKWDVRDILRVYGKDLEAEVRQRLRRKSGDERE